jgi:hypothetical protein
MSQDDSRYSEITAKHFIEVEQPRTEWVDPREVPSTTTISIPEPIVRTDVSEPEPVVQVPMTDLDQVARIPSYNTPVRQGQMIGTPPTTPSVKIDPWEAPTKSNERIVKPGAKIRFQ